MTTIVPFSPDHAEPVVAVILPIQREEFGIDVTLAEQTDLHDIAAFYQHGDGNFWVALDEGRVVGTIALMDIGNHLGALRKMFVAATHRGREHGVARALLETLLAWSRERGMECIYLGTTDKFLAAHRFYEKNGFAEITRAELPEGFLLMKVDTKFYARGP